MADHRELFSSLVADIKSYSGTDPLRPWLRGVRRMKESLPAATLREKLPRFLQKCAQAFDADHRYRDDPRYLRVWIELMDYVEDAKPLLKKMERNQIGLKRASFYLAYALYYEKHKRFEEAEKMYYLGVHNLAEPIGELKKSHEQFLHRMELYKRRKAKLQEGMPSKVGSIGKCIDERECTAKQKGDSRSFMELKNNPVQKSGSSSNPAMACHPPLGPAKNGVLSRGGSACNKNLARCNSDDTVVVRFVGSAFVGKSEAEDACHHGLVEPTINTKEAMNAINSMFLEPLEPETMFKRCSKRDQPKLIQQTSAFEIFVDEDGPNGDDQNARCSKNTKQDQPKLNKQTSAFEIFVHEDEPNGNDQNARRNKNTKQDQPKLNQQTSAFEIFVDEDEPNANDQNAGCNKKNTKHPPELLSDSSKQQGKGELQKPFVGGFTILADDDEDEPCHTNDDGVQVNSGIGKPTHSQDTSFHLKRADSKANGCDDSHPIISGLREDTVIHRFVGSAVLGEPKVENACHHGLVDPTVNLKEAMDEINSMFGKPLNFKGERLKRKQTNALSERKPAPDSGFSILADDDLEENSVAQAKPSTACKFGAESDLFEPTITTRDVMAEINDMFGMSLDF